MKKVVRYYAAFCLSTFLAVSAVNGQSNQEKEAWRRIVPLVTNAVQVEKILGPPMSRNGKVSIYDTREARITVWYGGGKSAGEECVWDVSDDTVVSVVVSPKIQTELARIGFDLTLFTKKGTNDSDVWNYVSEELGIGIETYDSGEGEIVLFLHLSPTATDRKRRCIALTQEQSKARHDPVESRGQTCNIAILCEPIESGWKGLRPMRATKAAVEKILGQGKIDGRGSARYVNDEAAVQVNYSPGPCKESAPGLGKYDIPENVVIDYVVHFRKDVKLTEIDFRREKYYKDTSGDVLNFFDYVNSGEGIIISVTTLGSDEYVRKIAFRASKEDLKKFECKF